MAAISEKSSGPSAFSPHLDAVANLFHPVTGPVYNTYARFHGWKESMGLVQPGTVENLTREVSRESNCLLCMVYLVKCRAWGEEIRLVSITGGGRRARSANSSGAERWYCRRTSLHAVGAHANVRCYHYDSQRSTSPTGPLMAHEQRSPRSSPPTPPSSSPTPSPSDRKHGQRRTTLARSLPMLL